MTPKVLKIMRDPAVKDWVKSTLQSISDRDPDPMDMQNDITLLRDIVMHWIDDLDTMSL